jgi:hypothetical protein
MSTSQKHSQVIANVAGLLSSLSRLDDDASPAAKPAKALAERLIGPFDALSQNEMNDRLASKLLTMNEESLKANYPDYNFEREDGAITPRGDDIMPVDTVDGLIFARIQLSNFEHGLYEDNYYNYEKELEALNNGLILDIGAKTTANKLDMHPKNEAIAKIAESMTRLNTHGDYLYDMTNGGHNTIAQLALLTNNPDHNYGDDVYAMLLQQLYDNKDNTLTIPKGVGGGNARSFRQLRTDSYSITSDVPSPSQQDADIVNAAALAILKYTKSATLVDIPGEPLDDFERNIALDRITSYVTMQIQNSNALRFLPYMRSEGKTFKQAQDKARAFQTPSNTFTFAINGDFPAESMPEKRNFSLSETVEMVNQMAKDSGGRMVRIDTPESLAALQKRYPDLSVREFTFSDAELQALHNYDVIKRPLSAAKFTLGETIHDTFESLGFSKDNTKAVEDGPLNVALKQAIRRNLPGIDDRFDYAVSSVVRHRHSSTNGFNIADSIIRELPDDQKENMDKPGEVFSISAELAKHFEPSQEDLPIGTPALKR